MTEYLLLPLTFLCTFLGCLLVVIKANKHQWLDRPNNRSSHATPTPTSGGLPLVIVFSIAVLVAFSGEPPGFNHHVVLVAGAFVALLGLADDILSLGIWSRIGVQLLVVITALALFGIPPLPVYTLNLQPSPAGYLFAVLLFVWFINLFNFMDGIDGIAGMETLFICAAVFVLTMGSGHAGFDQFNLLLMAATCGFLVLNLAPARLFMGDVGSNYLGFLLGVLALASTTMGDTTLWTWLILAGVFLVDATLTLLTRALNGETWYHAHRSHAYQRAAMQLGSHGKTVTGVCLINCGWLFPLAWLSQRFPQHGAILTLIAWLPLVFLVRFLGKRSVTVQPA